MDSISGGGTAVQVEEAIVVSIIGQQHLPHLAPNQWQNSMGGNTDRPDSGVVYW